MEISSDILRQKAQDIRYFFTDVDGTLTDGTVYYSSEGELLKNFSLRDGTGFFLLRECGIKSGIITTEQSLIVAKRAEKLHVDVYLYGALHKVESIQSFLDKNNLGFANIAYIGDEINDVRLLSECGLSFAVADADSRVKKVADVVCQQNGGAGAFREAVEILLELKGIDIDNIILGKL